MILLAAQAPWTQATPVGATQGASGQVNTTSTQNFDHDDLFSSQSLAFIGAVAQVAQLQSLLVAGPLGCSHRVQSLSCWHIGALPPVPDAPPVASVPPTAGAPPVGSGFVASPNASAYGRVAPEGLAGTPGLI